MQSIGDICRKFIQSSSKSKGVGAGGEYRIINNNSLCDSCRVKQTAMRFVHSFLYFYTF
jgi:hypothetical protein